MPRVSQCEGKESGAAMTTRIRRLEKAYDALILDMQHDYPHTPDRSELMRGASRHGSTITYTLQGQNITAARQTEVDGLQLAAGLIAMEAEAPLVARPNRYHNLKRCACSNHEGERWINRSQFSADRAHIDGLHAYCRKCRAAQAKFAYVPKWRRGV